MGQGRRGRRRRHARLKSSSRAVLGNDDLLTLILLHVPWKTLMSLKCVSKQWLSLIANPHFIRLRSLHPLPTSAFFFHIGHQSNQLYFVHLEHSNTPSPFSTMKFTGDAFNPRNVLILRSCNGIFLCCTSLNVVCQGRKRRYYVCNPCTNQVDTLPKHPCPDGYILQIDLIFDPLKSVHYKVISFITIPRANAWDFHIYSSETGSWRILTNSFDPAQMICRFKDGVYWNGGMHWLSECVKSQLSSDGFYFNVDEERLQTFPSPPMVPIKEWYSRDRSYFGESQGHLHYAEVCPYDPSFNVYEMKSDYSGWFVKYQIDLVPISKAFPIMKECAFYSVESFNVAVASLVRRENFKQDSVLVLEIPCRIIHYNLVDRSFKVIWNFAVDLEKRCISLSHYRCGSLIKAWPYNQ